MAMKDWHPGQLIVVPRLHLRSGSYLVVQWAGPTAARGELTVGRPRLGSGPLGGGRVVEGAGLENR